MSFWVGGRDYRSSISPLHCRQRLMTLHLLRAEHVRERVLVSTSPDHELYCSS